jgi:hypothetical protein
LGGSRQGELEREIVPLDADTAFLKSYSSFDAGYALCGGRKRLNVVREGGTCFSNSFHADPDWSL